MALFSTFVPTNPHTPHFKMLLLFPFHGLFSAQSAPLPTWCDDEIIIHVFPGMEWLPRESRNIPSGNGGEHRKCYPLQYCGLGEFHALYIPRGHQELDMTERVSRTPGFQMQCGRLPSCARQRLDPSSSKHLPQLCASVTSLQESRVNVSASLAK